VFLRVFLRLLKIFFLLAAMSDTDVTLQEKSKGAHNGYYNDEKDGHRTTKEEQIRAVDAIAIAQGVNRGTFAHIDEKKLLRKMDIRLIPMLTLLYLLSFIDRGNIVSWSSILFIGRLFLHELGKCKN
jgi:hypothetical protein